MTFLAALFGRFSGFTKLLPYIAVAGLALFAAVQFIQARHYKKQFANEHEAHAITKSTYAAAQAHAALMNKAKVAQITAQYDALAKTSEKIHAQALADSRNALSQFLRSQAAKGSTSGSRTSTTPEIQPGIAGTGEVSNIFDGFVSVPVSDLELAAGAYAKLYALQEAARGVQGVVTE